MFSLRGTVFSLLSYCFVAYKFCSLLLFIVMFYKSIDFIHLICFVSEAVELALQPSLIHDFKHSSSAHIISSEAKGSNWLLS